MRNINFNKLIDECFYKASLLHIYVYNEKDELIDSFSLYEEYLSQLQKFSNIKPKNVKSEEHIIIYVNTQTFISCFLIVLVDIANICGIGFYKNKIYVHLQTVIIPNNFFCISDDIPYQNDIIDLFHMLKSRYHSFKLLKKLV